jgi:hypothetical protein
MGVMEQGMLARKITWKGITVKNKVQVKSLRWLDNMLLGHGGKELF